jgi:putative flippase GtrA
MEFVRFIVCGAVNTGVTFIIYVCLLWFVSYAVAYTISYAAGIFISYWLNAKFVFQEPLSISRALQYPLVYLVQYLLGLALLFLLVEIAHLSSVVAPLLVVILTLPVTFFCKPVPHQAVFWTERATRARMISPLFAHRL